MEREENGGFSSRRRDGFHRGPNLVPISKMIFNLAFTESGIYFATSAHRPREQKPWFYIFHWKGAFSPGQWQRDLESLFPHFASVRVLITAALCSSKDLPSHHFLSLSLSLFLPMETIFLYSLNRGGPCIINEEGEQKIPRAFIWGRLMGRRPQWEDDRGVMPSVPLWERRVSLCTCWQMGLDDGFIYSFSHIIRCTYLLCIWKASLTVLRIRDSTTSYLINYNFPPVILIRQKL